MVDYMYGVREKERERESVWSSRGAAAPNAASGDTLWQAEHAGVRIQHFPLRTRPPFYPSTSDPAPSLSTC